MMKVAIELDSGELCSVGETLRDEAVVHPESRGTAIWGEGHGIHSLPAAFSSERYFLPPPSLPRCCRGASWRRACSRDVLWRPDTASAYLVVGSGPTWSSRSLRTASCASRRLPPRPVARSLRSSPSGRRHDGRIRSES